MYRLLKLDFTVHAHAPVLAFWIVLAPLDWFLSEIMKALDKTITITMPGCPGSSTGDVLTKLTKEELNERVINATGMNLKAATKPLTAKEYAHHPEVLKFRNEFAQTLKLAPIQEWYNAQHYYPFFFSRSDTRVCKGTNESRCSS